MSLEKIPYKQLKTLIKRHLSINEFPETRDIINELCEIKKRGYLKRSELIKICKWKSPRTIHHIETNSPSNIKRLTKFAFGSKSEKLKIETLTKLKGVSIPMASAILMFSDPELYGVLDIRVWQLLYEMNSVNINPKGKGFNSKQWYQYLMIIRYYAHMYKVSARDIERTLFLFHREYQTDTLY